MHEWLTSPAGEYLLAWEQRHLDSAVADLFGFHAVQLGLPQLDGLRANRMPHRWLAVEAAANNTDDNKYAALKPALRCRFDALPFDTASLDLVVMPHVLELAHDPHLTLREVDRVLVPDGRALIVGFNPASLWGLRQRAGRLRRAVGLGRGRDLFLPRAGEFIGHRRLRDWLQLLSFEVESGRRGCYIPPLRSGAWLARFGWMESAGERWWPPFGALYYMVAVKRVRGMRLVGLARSERRLKAGAAVTAPAPAGVSPHVRERDAVLVEDRL